MPIVCFTKPELQIVHEVRELEKICQVHDQLQGSLFLDPSLNFSPDVPCLLALYEGEELAGAMTFFAPTQEEVEVVVLTHPAYRRRGVFRALVQEAARNATQLQIPDFLFVCEPQSVDGVAALGWFSSKLDHTEYALRYDRTIPPDRLVTRPGLTMHRAAAEDLSVMAEISAESFSEEVERAAHFMELALVSKTRKQYLFRLDGEPVAIGALGIEDGESTIYGLGVRPQQQNKGIGRSMVALLVKESYALGVEDILIEVDSTNARAHHLYLSCGFVAEATYDYLRAPVSQFLTQET